MNRTTPPRRTAAVLTAAAVASGALLIPGGAAAAAAEGPAPSPTEYRVVAGVHTDAVSTFLDDGAFSLGSKADLPEGNGTRLDEARTWFQLENDAATTIPPSGYDFIAPAGTQVWIAPESNPGNGRLWPGFNTESIGTGAIDGNTTTFTLTGVDGPGDLEVFTGGGFGGPNRLWSSDETEFRTFDVGRTHMHANWAFTEAGTYNIHVESTVTIGGTAQRDTATYTFVVGELPEQQQTTTALRTSTTELVLGDSVDLIADITPADAAGFVEFRDGDTVLGHEPVVSGTATMTTEPGVGEHRFTAAFVPAVANRTAASSSEAAIVSVVDESGVPLGITGIRDAYAPGDTLSARVAGHTLQEGETYRWLWRQVGTSSAYVLTGGGEEAAGRLSLPVDMTHDDYELSVQVRQGRQTVAQTPWVELQVRSEVQPLASTFPSGAWHLGDELLVELEGALADGDTIRIAQRGTAGPWYDFTSFNQVDEDTLQLTPEWQSTGVQWTIQTVRNGVVVAQSTPVAKDVLLREVLVEGVRSVYRVGQTLNATASVYPPIEGLTYTWALERYFDEAPYYETIPIKEGSTEADLSLELPIEAEHQGWTLAFIPNLPAGHPSGATQVGTYSQPLTVSDSSPDTQLLFLESLSAHYHQGYDVNLSLVADPALADGDEIAWQWKWPGADWTTLPDSAGLSHKLVAEQALDGVEVRATLQFAGGDTLTTEPVTILVDDHGSAAHQRINVSGTDTSYSAGDDVTLTASSTPASVLTRWEWYVQREGETSPMLLEDENTAELSFAATEELDGAAVFARLTFDDGTAYVESAPQRLSIQPAPQQPIETAIMIEGLAGHYHSGDTMTLKAVQNPATGEDHWHWFIRPAGATEDTVIAGALTDTLIRTVEAVDAGASIIARLYDHDHRVIAESAPVTIAIDDHTSEPVDPEQPVDPSDPTEPGQPEEPAPVDPGTPGQPSEPATPDVTGKPGAAPAARTGADLDGIAEGGLNTAASTPRGGVIAVDLGEQNAGRWLALWLFSEPALLGGDWQQVGADGTVSVRVPDTTALGEHRIAAFGADGTVIGWSNLTVTAAEPAATGSLTPTGADLTPLWAGGLLLAVGVAFIAARTRREAITA